MGWNLKHDFFFVIFVYNFVLNSNLSDNFLYLLTITFKLAKHKMAAKMQIIPLFSMISRTWNHNWWILQDLYYIYIFLVSLKRNNIYLTFKYNMFGGFF